MPLKYCVKNPRPDEIVNALKSLKIRHFYENDVQRPRDPLHLGRIKFCLFDDLGNLLNDKY